MIIVMVLMFVVGAVSASFLTASVWRLRAKQLATQHSKTESKEYQLLVKQQGLAHQSTRTDYSRCLHCSYRLRWYDMLPVISWLLLKGKCRRCGRAIGATEFLSELAVGALFAAFYYYWQQANFLSSGLGLLGFWGWLVCWMLLVILFIYDLKWMLLPSAVLYASMLSSAVFALWHLSINYSTTAMYHLLGAILILSGLYWLLSKISFRQQRLVGDGDACLGFSLACLLGNWQLALLAVFLANFLGVLLVLPKLLMAKIKFGQQLPFGPLLIAGSLISYFWGTQLLAYFLSF